MSNIPTYTSLVDEIKEYIYECKLSPHTAWEDNFIPTCLVTVIKSTARLYQWCTGTALFWHIIKHDVRLSTLCYRIIVQSQLLTLRCCSQVTKPTTNQAELLAASHIFVVCFFMGMKRQVAFDKCNEFWMTQMAALWLASRLWEGC